MEKAKITVEITITNTAYGGGLAQAKRERTLMEVPARKVESFMTCMVDECMDEVKEAFRPVKNNEASEEQE